MISHLHTSNDVQTWLTGKNSAQQDDEHDDEDSDDEVEEEEMDLQSDLGVHNDAASNPPGTTSAPAFFQHGLLLILTPQNPEFSPRTPLSLTNQSHLTRAFSPVVSQYPHINFAIVTSSTPSGTPKGPVSDYLQISVTPTVLLFSRTQSSQPQFSSRSRFQPPPTKPPSKPFLEVARYVGDGMSGNRDVALPREVKEILERVPKVMVFSGTASNTTTAAPMSARDARLKRFEQQQQMQQQQMQQQQMQQQQMQVEEPPQPPQLDERESMDTSTPVSPLAPGPTAFTSDPVPMQSYDVKYGLKSSASVLEEEKARNLQERRKQQEKIKREKIAAREERERLKALIENDKEERKLRNGYLNSKLGADGYNPPTLQKPPTHDVGDVGGGKKQRMEETRSKEEILSDCVRKIGMYRVGGEGGEVLNFLSLVVGNAVKEGNGQKYWRINTASKGYRAKVKGKNGARKTLELVGFRMEPEAGWMSVREDLWDEGWAREAKRVIDRAAFAFEQSVRKALEENANRLEKKEPGT